MTTFQKELTLEELKKAAKSLKISQQLLSEALMIQKDNIDLHKALRDSCIQRFEFCVELAWKTSIKVLGLNTKSPNIAIRDMAQNKLITETEIWFDFLQTLNKTSHTYNEDIATQVYNESVRILPELELLLEKLEKF